MEIWSNVTARYTKISEEKLNFAKQIFAMEPISIIFAKFNYAIWGNNHQNKFHEYFFT